MDAAPEVDEERLLAALARQAEAPEAGSRGRTARDAGYPHADRRCPYRSEKRIVTPAEAARIEAARASTGAPAGRPPAPARRPLKLILDTDIGTDADDVLALLMLLHLPAEDVELVGVTTAYGFTHVRAAVAERMIGAFAARTGRPAPPTYPGAATPLGTHRPVWHTGGEGIGALEDAEIERLRAEADFLPGRAPRDYPAARFIVEATACHPGEVTIVAIGPLTNLADALALDPALPGRVPRVVVMGLGSPVPLSGGVFHPNHNLSADSLAAARVFASELRIDVIHDGVTTRLWWGQAFDAADAEDPAARAACLALLEPGAPAEWGVAGRLLATWLRYRSILFRRRVRGTCPHDPLAVAEAVYPARFVAPGAAGHLVVHEWAAFGTFVTAPDGPHRLAADVRAEEFIAFLTERLRPPS